MWAQMVREGGPFPLSRIVLQKLDLVPALCLEAPHRGPPAWCKKGLGLFGDAVTSVVSGVVCLHGLSGGMVSASPLRVWCSAWTPSV